MNRKQILSTLNFKTGQLEINICGISLLPKNLNHRKGREKLIEEIERCLILIENQIEPYREALDELKQLK